MNPYRVAFKLLVIAAPLINFSFIPNSNLPVAYLITILIAVLIPFTFGRLSARSFGQEDIYFGAFLLWSLISFVISYRYYPSFDGLAQIINLFLTYLILKVALALLYRSNYETDEILRSIFKINTWYSFLAVLMFWITLVSGRLLDMQLEFFNNSGNFDLTNIGHTFSVARSFGFGPEPSFWSFFIALNIALALIIPKPGRLLLAINAFNLVLTYGRTGFLIMAVVLVIRFSKRSIVKKLLVLIAGIALVSFFYDQLDISRLKDVDSSFWDRFDSLLSSLDIIVRNPLFGIGLGNFDNYAEIARLSYHDIFNLYFTFAVSCGLVGLFFFSMMLYRLYKRMNARLNLPFYAVLVGWVTMSAYNLPFVWVMIAALIYCSDVIRKKNEVTGEYSKT